MIPRSLYVGERISLIPYTLSHVPLYFKWLSDPQTSLLVSTEPSTSLDEELEHFGQYEQRGGEMTTLLLEIRETGELIGDVSLVRCDLDAEGLAKAGVAGQQQQPQQHPNGEGVDIIEVNIMIAERERRGLGYAREAIKILQDYCMTRWRSTGQATGLVAKISADNTRSKALFQHSGFVDHAWSEAFQEFTMLWFTKDSSNKN